MTGATVLLIGLLMGFPVLLLALAIGYQAAAGGRRRAVDNSAAAAATSTRPAIDPRPELGYDRSAGGQLDKELLHELQRSLQQITEQLTGQREVLTGLLSEHRHVAAAAPPTAPQAAPLTAPLAAPAPPVHAPAADLRAMVARLTAEGLSERSVARRLRIGLEEVRLIASVAGPAAAGERAS